MKCVDWNNFQYNCVPCRVKCVQCALAGLCGYLFYAKPHVVERPLCFTKCMDILPEVFKSFENLVRGRTPHRISP